MEEVLAQSSGTTTFIESPEILKLKRRVRSAGWVATSIGYLYLLLSILGTVGFISASAMTALFAPFSFAIFSLVAAILGGFIIFLTLVMLGKRLTTIEKGFMWRPGEMIMDKNIKSYLIMLAILSGLLFAGSLIAWEPSFDMLIAAVLFGYMCFGLIAVNKLYSIPEFVNKLGTRPYKTSTNFWWSVIAVAVLLQILPFLQVIFRI